MQFDINNEEHRNKLACEAAFYMMETEYRNRGKYLNVPTDYMSKGGFPFGKIWLELSEQYQKGELSDDNIKFLIRLRMNLQDSPRKDMEKWMDKADEAGNYYKQHGTLSMPNTQKFDNGTSMFQWIHHQKALYKRGELSVYQQKRLEEMGIQWIKPYRQEKPKNKWERAYELAECYYKEHGHLLMERSYRTKEGFPLGSWVAEQRDAYLGIGAYPLSSEKKERLEEIGMCWENPARAKWSWFIKMLSEYMDSTEQPFPIRKDFRYKNYELGKELLCVLRDYVNKILPREKIQDMKKIGFQFKKGLFVKN